MHSPWGVINQIMEKKGWSLNYILEKISWINIQMLAKDNIKMVKRSEMIIKVSKKNLKKHKQQLKDGYT